MAIMEVVVFYDGFILFVRRYYDVRAIQDDDVVANTLHNAFLNLKENISMVQEDSVSWNLTMERHKLHVLMKRFSLPQFEQKQEIFVYIVDDKSNVEKDIATILEKTLQKFVADYGDMIDVLMKQPEELPEFKEFIDKYLKKLTKKQYKRFFNLWNKPRLNFDENE